MANRTTKELREELGELMREHIESLKSETFLKPSEEEVRRQEERLKRIREVSADYLAALKRNDP
jgi:hypothetical protein